jgi:hypothetical protein
VVSIIKRLGGDVSSTALLIFSISNPNTMIIGILKKSLSRMQVRLFAFIYVNSSLS